MKPTSSTTSGRKFHPDRGQRLHLCRRLPGFDDPEILIGGTAPYSLKKEIKAAIEGAIAGSGNTGRIAYPDEGFGSDSPKNIVNRLTAGGANGIQLEI